MMSSGTEKVREGAGDRELRKGFNGLKIDGGRQEGAGRKEGGMMIHDFTMTRPKERENKKGVSGTPVKLRSNYIPVLAPQRNLLYQYSVKFEPTVESKAARVRLLEGMAGEMAEEPPLVFDGAILYLSHQMKECEEGGAMQRRRPHPTNQQDITLTLKLTNELPSDSPQCITILNLLNRKIMSLLDYKQFGRHFFNPDLALYVQKHKIEIWPGLISAIRCYENDLLLNVDMAHKLLRKESVYEFMRSKDWNQALILKELIGSSVMTRYNNKMYRVDDVIFTKNPKDSTFTYNGKEMSYQEYYEQQYSKKIQDPTQPLLLSKGKKKGPGEEAPMDIYLIPEFSTMTGLTDQMRADRRVMQDVAVHTRVSPDKRVSNFREYLDRLHREKDAKKLLEKWNLEVGDDLVQVDARVLPTESLSFGGNSAPVHVDSVSADWTREAKGRKAVEAKDLKNWLFVLPSEFFKSSSNFFDCMKRVGPQVGMQIEDPVVVQMQGHRTEEYIQALKENLKGKNAVVVIVPNSNKERYDAIKKECCLGEYPETLIKEKILQSVCGKILLQMMCKMGGALWKVKNPMKKSRVMLVGYDSYSDSSARGKSVGAAVFSMDQDLTHWFSQAKLHGQGAECVDNIVKFFRRALEEYRQKNEGEYPNRVFFFRDGVGEGQIPVVYNVELGQVQTAFKEIYGSEWEEKVQFAFIIVTKRVNTRFFKEGSGSQKFTNPGPGTVVDDVVTRRERYDFYLIPQAVGQGTVTPVSYNVIYDNSGLSPDHMHRLTFKLCHLYYNWQGTIRVPAPCQYAAKLAFLVGQSLHDSPSGELEHTLYFL